MDNARTVGERSRPSARMEWPAGTLEAVLSASPDLVYLCDRAGTFLYANAAGARYWGRDRADLLGMTWQELGLPVAVTDSLARQREAVFDTGRALVAEVGISADGDGATCWETLLTPIQGDGGGVEVVVMALRDITSKKRAEKALCESEEKYRILAENSTDMISRHDPEGRYLYASPACRTLLGYEPEELIGRSAYAFIHPDDLLEITTTHAAILRSPEVSTVTFRARRKDGRDIWFETTTRTIRDADSGAVLEIHCASRDVSERKHAEEALRESRERLEAILDNTTAVIYIKDDEGRYVLVNRWFETLFHVSHDWLLGKTDDDFFPKACAEAFRENDRQVLECGGPLEFEEEVPHDDGMHTYISIKFPIRAGPGPGIAHIGGISTDITERKAVEERLRHQNEMLQQAVHSERHAHQALKRAESQLVQAEKLSALGQMVAGVAHEINNPLAFVTSDVAVLKREVGHLRDLLGLWIEAEETLAAQRPELLARIRERSERVDLPFLLENLDRLLARSTEGLRRIRQIVKDLRDFARLDEGDLKEVDLNDGIASTVNLIQGRAKTQDISLETDLEPLPPATCYPGKINQVVLNLLSNAIDACPPGGKVTLRTRAVPEGVEIHVIDTGHGIDPAIRDKIFDPFFTTKPIGRGTGLGLSISYGIVQAHGGTIAVDSEPGRGTHFTIRLPLTVPC